VRGSFLSPPHPYLLPSAFGGQAEGRRNKREIPLPIGRKSANVSVAERPGRRRRRVRVRGDGM